MKKLFCLLALVCLSCVSIYAQDLQKRAIINPLDCALYLLKLESDFGSRSDELKKLSIAYWHSNRKSDALTTLDLIEDEDRERKVEVYLLFAEDLVEKNNYKEATPLLLSALKYVDKNEFEIGFDDLNKLSYNLALTGNEESANKLIDSIDEKYFKAEFSVTIADALQKKGESDKALLLLPVALKYAEDSSFEKQRYSAIGSIAKKYADLGKNELAINLFDQVKNDANLDKELFEVIFQSYLDLNLIDRAEELIKNNEVLNDSELALKYAELSYKEGNKEKTIKYLQKAAVFAEEAFDKETKLYPYDFAESVTNLYLKLDEDIFALDFAGKLKKTVPQQFSLLKIADYYFKKQQFESAESVLSIAFEKLKNADENQFDFGNISIIILGNITLSSDSERLSKEFFLWRIADGFFNLNKFDRALKVINSIEIQYYRAGGLARFSQKQKNKLSKTTLLENLARAKLLIETDKDDLRSENKIKYWLILASFYKEIGESDKSLNVFADILEKIKNEKNLSESDKIYSLVTIGSLFEKSNNKADKKIRDSLSKIIENWKENL